MKHYKHIFKALLLVIISAFLLYSYGGGGNMDGIQEKTVIINDSKTTASSI